MRNYALELEKRVSFIKEVLKNSHADGIIFGNSGGKDCTLVGILCKRACDNVLSVMMPCNSSRNFGEDMQDAVATCKKFEIENITVDLSKVKDSMVDAIPLTISPASSMNINPRLRMTTLYSIAQTRNSVVAGTGNKCEIFMGYFTKWGDGACDFNPIADLSVSEVYEFLEFLGAPENIIKKAPSAGLFEGQTDEQEMGVLYSEIEDFINRKEVLENSAKKISSAHERTHHKRKMPLYYTE